MSHSNSRAMWRRLAATAAVATTALLGAACAGGTTSGETTGVAALEQPATTAPAQASDAAAALEAPDNPEEAFALFEDCMADAGFEMGIAVSGGGGDLNTVAGGGNLTVERDPQISSIDEFNPAAFQEANEQCQGHLAAIDAGFDMTPEQQAAFADAQLEWQECMGEHGVEVPDLGAGGGGLSIVIGGTDDADPQSGGFGGEDFDFEAFEAAASECDDAFDQLGDHGESDAEDGDQ